MPDINAIPTDVAWIRKTPPQVAADFDRSGMTTIPVDYLENTYSIPDGAAIVASPNLSPETAGRFFDSVLLSASKVEGYVDDGAIAYARLCSIFGAPGRCRNFNMWQTSAVGDMLEGRNKHVMVGTTIAAIVVGGERDLGAPTGTEENNNGVWATGVDPPNRVLRSCACGTKNAALVISGSSTQFSQGFDGSSWTVFDTEPDVREAVLIGTVALALRAGGWYNGARTTECWYYENGAAPAQPSCNMNTAVFRHIAVGTYATAVSFGGDTAAGSTAAMEAWNGLTWSGGASMITAVESHAGAGTPEAAFSFGGDGPTGETEEFNGIVWSVAGVADMLSPIGTHTGCGTHVCALSAAGKRGFDYLVDTEVHI